MKTNIRLMTIRVKKGIKQWQLARDVGIHETVYSRIESGRQIPGRELQLRIAGRLGVEVKDIFFSGDQYEQ